MTKLTHEQLAVLHHPLDQHARVLAVAGSGKSTTMAYRIKHLVLEHGVRPGSIQVLMFNALARKQFAAHLDKIGLTETQQPKVHTFHSFSFHIITEMIKRGYLPPNTRFWLGDKTELIWLTVKRAITKLEKDKWLPAIALNKTISWSAISDTSFADPSLPSLPRFSQAPGLWYTVRPCWRNYYPPTYSLVLEELRVRIGSLESRSTLVNFEQFSLDPRINAGIKAVGYKTPTPIQQQAIPVVLEGRDVLGLAQTGTGKTAAFILPILQRLTRGPLSRVRVLIVAPTRELAEQIYQASVDLGKRTRVRSVTVYGGVSKNRQIERIKRGAEIVVACPGRLLDIVGDGDIDLSQVEVLVLDEADRMCDMGFLPDIRRIIKLLPKKRQTLFFSATMPDDIRELSASILHNPTRVQIGMIAPAETVSHALYPVTQGLKKSLLLAMLEQTATGRVLIFTRTKRRARFLARDLENLKYRVSALQGNMSQNRRQQAIDGFRNAKYDILVATDIAARGIDVSEISHVINYDMPDTVDAYTHRIGRTGRAHKNGEAFTLAVPEDAPMVRDIEKVLKTRIERRQIPGFDYSGFQPENQFQGGASGRKQHGVPPHCVGSFPVIKGNGG